MTLLLDTHVLLWWLDDPALVSIEARTAIADGRNTVFVSVAVVWEILIKKAHGKLDAPENLDEVMQEERFRPLPITLEHVLALPSLPSIHDDPFDRIQAAQAKVENLRLVTRDDRLKQYGLLYIAA